MEATSEPPVIELTGSAIAFGKEHKAHNDVTLEVWTQGGRFKYRIRIGGNLGKKLTASRVRSRRKD